jgi:tRNA-dihydrouridine synthase
MHIWQQLKQAGRPFLVLAPMDDVTDTVFREVVACAAAPDLMMTEFASSDGFAHPEGRASVERRLYINESEAALGVPLIAQIWGANPDHYYQMARELAARGGFVGIDINMGCPEKGIVRRGCCGGLIKEENWGRAAEIIAATKAGAGELPVSVKTRIGVGTGQLMTEEWCGHLLRQGIAALSIHARTVREMSKVPARWEEIGKVVQLRDGLAPETVIIGNGDVENRAQAEALAARYGVDGVMIGRGVLRDLFAFAAEPREEPAPAELQQILLDHMALYESTWGGRKSYEPLKKFCKLYISGFAGAAELRGRLMETRTPDEARAVLAGYAATPIAISPN